MRKNKKIYINLILLTALLVLEISKTKSGMVALATSIGDVQNQINKTQNQLKDINDLISDLEESQELVYEMIDDLNAEIVNTMTSIGMKEDNIKEKEEEIERKKADIDEVHSAYDAALVREEEQYEAMVNRIRYIYENNNSSVLSYYLEGSDISSLLGQSDYVEKLYEHDQNLMDDYTATKNLVQEMWNQLEKEKMGLENARIQLETDRASLQAQKSDLDKLLAQKKQESSNYESEIAKARQEAATAKKRLQQEEQQLKQLQAQQSRPNAASGSYNVTAFDASVIDNAAGSDLGKKIAKYACQYIGNPYVSGGTSLTNGADCSGYIYKVYQDFGYTVPRTSYELRSSGKSVSYDQAQPGDIICYDGHVGIYVGSGYIVHASSAKTGIKVSRATYRSIVDVRRII